MHARGNFEAASCLCMGIPSRAYCPWLLLLLASAAVPPAAAQAWATHSGSLAYPKIALSWHRRGAISGSLNRTPRSLARSSGFLLDVMCCQSQSPRSSSPPSGSTAGEGRARAHDEMWQACRVGEEGGRGGGGGVRALF